MMTRLFIRLYVGLLVLLYLLFLCVSPTVEWLLKDEAIVVNREFGRGVFYLLQQQVEGMDEQGIRDHLALIQPEFGYPIGFIHMDDMDPAKDYYKDVAAGLIARDFKADMAFLRIKNSNLVLFSGPHNLDPLLKRGKILFRNLLFAILILPVAAWAFFMHKALKTIDNTATRFVAGDLTARLTLPSVYIMKNIASSFNHMAEKTQGLINSQKDLLNSVAHEIRTPLSRIRFSLEMLRDKTGNREDGQHYIGEIETDVTEISELVDEILTYQRFERNRLVSETLTRIDMVSWLNEIASRESKPGHTLTVSCSETSRMVSCEPQYLGRALRNLVRNALRYGTSRVDVLLESHDSGLRIHVDDDGPGIPPSEAERIFEPFYRLDQSRARNTGGYGLGLAIAQRIARWHNGAVSVTKSPLGGARFSIELPDPEMPALPGAYLFDKR